MAPVPHGPIGDCLISRLTDRRLSRRGLLHGIAAFATLSMVGYGPRAYADDGEYVVQPGNTLYQIARKFGMSVSDIASINGIANPNFLSVGQKLRVAAPAEPAPPATAPVNAAPPDANREVSSRGASPTGASVVEIARSCVGMPYAWAGTSPSVGFDCSGLVYYLYNRVGIVMDRNLAGQLASGPRVPIENLQPGDLVFFANTYEAGLSHVGVFIGDNQFIHAEDEWNGVRVSRLVGGYWGAHFYAANRPGARATR